MNSAQTLVAAVLGSGGLTTVLAALQGWRNRKRDSRKAEAEIGIDEATKSKIVQDAAHSIETDYLQRLADFRVDIARLNRELDEERSRASEWRDRLVLWEDYFYTKHMPWDRHVTVLARSHEWQIDDPPSVLDYFKEMQDRIEGRR